MGNNKKIIGTNLGNWLVLERWMKPDVFEGTGAEDEVWLARTLSKEDLQAKMKLHRDTYVTEEDFRYLADMGFEYLRIPVPFFIFGDRDPFVGCLEYLDKAFEWAKTHGLQILIDLHTVPGSQNGYDNGGITGVCKWCKNPEEVEFALSVLERLGERYGSHPALYGIEVLNEPISWIVYKTAPSTGKAKDKEEAKGSGYVPMKFLKPFYLEAYKRLRKHLGLDKVIVFHDGFRLSKWKKFFKQNKLENVAIDTHIYIFAMEMYCPIHVPLAYKIYIDICTRQLKSLQKIVPVLVGEWCLCNKYAVAAKDEETRKARYRKILSLELEAWNKGQGWFYWNYQLLRDREVATDFPWKESWDLARCIKRGYITKDDIENCKKA